MRLSSSVLVIVDFVGLLGFIVGLSIRIFGCFLLGDNLVYF